MKVKGITYITFKEDPEKAVVYKIIPSVDVIQRSKTGVSTPSTISFTVYKIEGGKQTQLAFDNSGVKMRVRKSNGSWENSINWTTKSYTVDSSTEWMEAQLFVNNSTWLDADLLDSKRVPVVVNGTDGDAAVQYWLETDTPIIHYDTNKVTNTASFVVNCKKKTGSGTATDCAEFSLSVAKYNGATWTTTTYTARNTITITTDKIYTRYRVRAVNGSGVTVCEIFVEAVFDGAIGPAGATGAIYLCRGEWNNLETYIKTAEVVHYVIYEGYAYEPKKASITGGSNPLADVNAGGANWKSLGRHDVIATRVLLANFALIAGGVFWNNKLMSQYGVNNSGATVNNYTAYSEDANGNENGTFHPNILIDFFKGYIKALQGFIGGFNIKDGKFESQQLTSGIANIILNGLTGAASFGGNKTILNANGSGQLGGPNLTFDASGNIVLTGKFESAKNGDRIIIDPSLKSIKMINSNGKAVLDMSFYNDSYSGSSANVTLYNYDSQGNQIGYTQMFGGRVIINKNGDIFDIGIDSNNKLLWLMDPSRLPTSGTYYGQIYRSGNNLCIRTT